MMPRSVCIRIQRSAQPRRACDAEMQPRRAPGVGWRGSLVAFAGLLIQSVLHVLSNGNPTLSLAYFAFGWGVRFVRGPHFTLRPRAGMHSTSVTNWTFQLGIEDEPSPVDGGEN